MSAARKGGFFVWTKAFWVNFSIYLLFYSYIIVASNHIWVTKTAISVHLFYIICRTSVSRTVCRCPFFCSNFSQIRLTAFIAFSRFCATRITEY